MLYAHLCRDGDGNGGRRRQHYLTWVYVFMYRDSTTLGHRGQWAHQQPLGMGAAPERARVLQ